MLTKETAMGHVGLTSTICRNFEFYQNDTKIRRKLAYEMYSCVQLLGGFAPPPRPPDQGLCPWQLIFVNENENYQKRKNDSVNEK